jgi:hypothetical protein
VTDDVDIGQAQADQLVTPHAGVEKEPDDGRVPPVLEGLGGTAGQQRPELVVGQHRHRLLGDDEGLHVRHRIAGNLALFSRPREEQAQRLVPGLRGRRQPGCGDLG